MAIIFLMPKHFFYQNFNLSKNSDKNADSQGSSVLVR